MGSNNSKESKLPGDYNNDSNPNSLNADQRYNFAAIDLLTNDDERRAIKKDLDRKGKYKIDSFNFFINIIAIIRREKNGLKKAISN